MVDYYNSDEYITTDENGKDFIKYNIEELEDYIKKEYPDCVSEDGEIEFEELPSLLNIKYLHVKYEDVWKAMAV